MQSHPFKLVDFFTLWTLILLCNNPVISAMDETTMMPIAETPLLVPQLVEWMTIPLDHLLRAYWPVAGVERGEKLYLCRVLQPPPNERYISGKLRIGASTRCLVANNGGAKQYEEYQVLVVPADTVSWIPGPTDGTVPEGSIVSGMSDAGRTQYVCRGFHPIEHRVDIIPGKWAPYQNRCYVVYNNREYGARAYEILVINDFGRATLTEGVPTEIAGAL